MKLADFQLTRCECAGLVRSFLLAIALLLLITGCGRDAEPPVSARAAFDHEHTLLDEVLQKHVRQGRVDYHALHRDTATLDRYLETLARIEPAAYEKWTREQKIALWINAYNAYTLRVILDHYPVTRSVFADPLRRYPASSIRQIPGVWKLRRWPVAGSTWTLDHMEHVILRRELVEPRIHFVLVCASISCPLLEKSPSVFPPWNCGWSRQRITISIATARCRSTGKTGLYACRRYSAGSRKTSNPSPEFAGHFARHPPEAAGVLTWIYRYASAEERDFLQMDAYEITYLEYEGASTMENNHAGTARIGVVIPARNEEDAIAQVLRAIPPQLTAEVVVVDNRSTDRTAAIARANWARGAAMKLLRLRAGSCRRALHYFAHRPVDIVVFLDGDYSDYPDEMARLIEPIVEDGYDFVFSTRLNPLYDPRSLLPHVIYGNKLVVFLINLLFGTQYTDLGPFRAIRHDALRRLEMRDMDYGWTVEMQAKARLCGLKTKEVPVRYRQRIGKSKISGTIKGTVLAGTIMLRTVMKLYREARRSRKNKK